MEKQTKEKFIPNDKEHLSQNKENLHKELMKKWIKKTTKKEK